jgi:hypothetical protein
VKEERAVVVFYILYFGWLFTLTTLTVDVALQNYFALFVVIFYFIFLRDYWDPIIFTVVSILAVIFSVTDFGPAPFTINYESLKVMPIWHPLSWGTTAVALKKFYTIVNNKLD